MSERICPVCGKRYYIHYCKDWLYKQARAGTSIVYYCSYKCQGIAKQTNNTSSGLSQQGKEKS